VLELLFRHLRRIQLCSLVEETGPGTGEERSEEAGQKDQTRYGQLGQAEEAA
jgi:hypothetical protein